MDHELAFADTRHRRDNHESNQRNILKKRPFGTLHEVFDTIHEVSDTIAEVFVGLGTVLATVDFN